MATVALAEQFQQWNFDKPACSGTSESSSSPKLEVDLGCSLLIDTSLASHHALPGSRKESVVLQERYLSSEEHLSSLGDDDDEDEDDDGSNSSSSVSEHESDCDYDKEPQEAKTAATPAVRWTKQQSCDLATVVAYSFAGRPKVVELANDCRLPRKQRSVSVANLPNGPLKKLRDRELAQRLSMRATALSSPSHDSLVRPSTSTVGSRVDLTGTQSPTLSFLTSDPFESPDGGSASSMNKRSAHRRLRSISIKALAKIVIAPSKKHAEGQTAPTPYASPAPLEAASPMSSPSRLARASFLRPRSRHMESPTSPWTGTSMASGPSPPSSKNHSTLPRCQGVEHESVGSRGNRKVPRRKSMMDLF